MSDRSLDEADAAADPFAQFRRWWADAGVAGQIEPDAMSLATVDDDGVPAVRFVLLKALDARGWVFYTNAGSAKGRQLEARPVAALAWRWAALDRQVRVTGAVEAVEGATADAYFASRARGSQVGAWASRQSSVLPDRAALDRAVAATEAGMAEGGVPRPPWWRGYRVVPSTVEFWQGRSSRLHDRLRYRRGGGAWIVERLSP